MGTDAVAVTSIMGTTSITAAMGAGSGETDRMSAAIATGLTGAMGVTAAAAATDLASAVSGTDRTNAGGGTTTTGPTDTVVGITGTDRPWACSAPLRPGRTACRLRRRTHTRSSVALPHHRGPSRAQQVLSRADRVPSLAGPVATGTNEHTDFCISFPVRPYTIRHVCSGTNTPYCFHSCESILSSSP
jgi:hypothetical protein